MRGVGDERRRPPEHAGRELPGGEQRVHRGARERDAHEAPLPVLARGRPGRGGALYRVFIHVGRGFYQTALSNSTRPSGRGARG